MKKISGQPVFGVPADGSLQNNGEGGTARGSARSFKGSCRRFERISLILCLAFFLLFAIYDGPVICVDSASYINMDSSRDPLYPLFLAFFRAIIPQGVQLYGQDAYLTAAVLAQSVINALSVWIFGLFIERTARRFRSVSISIRYGMAGIFFQLAVRLINRFVAIRGSMYSECIMSESLAMPLFSLFLVSLCSWVLWHRRRDFFLLILWMFLLLSTRGQMNIVLIILVLVSIPNDLIRRRSRSLKRFLAVILAAVLALCAFNIAELFYFHTRYGIWMKHTETSKAQACTLIYSADSEDSALFDRYGTPDQKEMFEQIITLCDEQNLLKADLPEDADWVTVAGQYADSYDIIGFDICPQVISPYMEEHYPGLEGVEYERQYDEVLAGICRVLRHQDKGDLLEVYADNILKGLICTNARVMPVLNTVSIILYAIYILFCVIIWMKRKKTLRLCSEIGMISILVNVLAVGAVIFPQPRYMFYNMPVFYTLLYLQIREAFSL